MRSAAITTRDSAPPPTSTDYAHLAQFLDADERPPGTLTLDATRGFLFAVCTAPEVIKPSEWIPLVFAEEEACYADEEEARNTLTSLMSLYNELTAAVMNAEFDTTGDLVIRAPAIENFAPDANLSSWATGFIYGYNWLSELWDHYLPDELEDEFASQLMAMGFFASRSAAEAFHAEGDKTRSFAAMCETMLAFFAGARKDFARLARIIFEVNRAPPLPEHSERVGRNDPCSCGSGKKYKKCCGAPPQRTVN